MQWLGESALVIEAKALYDAAQKEHVLNFEDRHGVEATYEGRCSDMEMGKLRTAICGWLDKARCSSPTC